MNRDLQRIAFLLASSGLTEGEIDRALHAIEREGVRSFLGMVADARRTIRLASQKLDAPEDPEAWSPSRGRHDSGPGTVAADIAKTFHDDLGLSTEQIVNAIRNSLLADKRISTAQSEIPHFRPKDGIKVWLQKLMQIVPSSVLLHHVSRIKNEISRRDRGDWPLRDRNG